MVKYLLKAHQGIKGHVKDTNGNVLSSAEILIEKWVLLNFNFCFLNFGYFEKNVFFFFLVMIKWLRQQREENFGDYFCQEHMLWKRNTENQKMKIWDERNIEEGYIRSAPHHLKGNKNLNFGFSKVFCLLVDWKVCRIFDPVDWVWFDYKIMETTD